MRVLDVMTLRKRDIISLLCGDGRDMCKAEASLAFLRQIRNDRSKARIVCRLMRQRSGVPKGQAMV